MCRDKILTKWRNSGALSDVKSSTGTLETGTWELVPGCIKVKHTTGGLLAATYPDPGGNGRLRGSATRCTDRAFAAYSLAGRGLAWKIGRSARCAQAARSGIRRLKHWLAC